MQLPIAQWSTLKHVVVTGCVFSLHSTRFGALYRGDRVFGRTTWLQFMFTPLCDLIVKGFRLIGRGAVQPDICRYC